MWEYLPLPPGVCGGAAWSELPGGREGWVEQLAAEKMREYDGAVFLFIARSDKERRLTFRRAAEALGLSARDGRAACTALTPQKLAQSPGRTVLFVECAMQRYLEEYLDACPAGARHLLLYTRRQGNGPSPHRSVFMDFWLSRGVDIFDSRQIDEL